VTAPNDPRRAPLADDSAYADDPSIVPGLDATGTDVPPPRGETSSPHAAGSGRLDPALDPDRYHPAREAAANPAGRSGPLDPTLDPDRYDPAREAARAQGQVPPGQGQTLTELLGDGAYEDKRDNYQWAIGLAGVLLFLAFFSWLFGSFLTA
jgi:hypothetical protein